MTSALTDLPQRLRREDYDRFLAIQRAPAANRFALYVLTAINAELASIAQTISEPLLGHIRLAWWREALEEMIAGKPPRAHPLLRVAADYPQTFPMLLCLIEARAAEFDPDGLTDEATWHRYLDNTAGALHLAWATCLNAAAAQKNAEAIAISARAYAMIGQARAIPYYAQHGLTHMPEARRSNIQGLVEEGAALLAQSPPLQAFPPLSALLALARLRARQLARAQYDPYNLRDVKLRAVLAVLFA